MKKLIISKEENTYHVQRLSESGESAEYIFDSIKGVAIMVNAIDELGYTIEVDAELFAEIVKELQK